MLRSSCWAVDVPEDDFVDEVDTHGLSAPSVQKLQINTDASTYNIHIRTCIQVRIDEHPDYELRCSFKISATTHFLRVCFIMSPLLGGAVLFLHVSVQHVLLCEQDDSASNALQPQGQEDGAVALAGETPTPQTNSRLVCQSVWCWQATRWAGAHDVAI